MSKLGAEKNQQLRDRLGRKDYRKAKKIMTININHFRKLLQKKLDMERQHGGRFNYTQQVSLGDMIRSFRTW